MPRARPLLTVGLALIALAFAGFLVTMIATSAAARHDGVEDLTTAWKAAGPTPLGGSTTVTVPPRETLVAFLVGTQLGGAAGTSTGRCAADADGHGITLGWPVDVNPSVEATLTHGSDLVAVAGWTNPGNAPVAVRISCNSVDSGVDHFVAVPTRTAAVRHTPWFQPWGWAGLAGVGAVLIGLGVVRGLRQFGGSAGPTGDPTG